MMSFSFATRPPKALIKDDSNTERKNVFLTSENGSSRKNKSTQDKPMTEEETKLAANGTAEDGISADEKEDEYKVDVEINVEEGREQWGKKAEFFLACIGYAVGLGNVWRFPYLAFKNGGGAFLIPYIIMLFLVGMPLFFMELALGQYVSLGPVTSWAAICPLGKGVGFSMLVISFLCCVYYNVIIAWCLYYLFESFRSVVPWKTCNNWWNTAACRTAESLNEDQPIGNSSLLNATDVNSCINGTITSIVNATSVITNCTSNVTQTVTKTTMPSEEYWDNYVLRITDDMGKIGEIRWQLLLTLILAWVLVYFCLWKGIKSSGKVVYFTATFPYFVLIILFFRGVTLPGSLEGVKFYVTPDFEKLRKAEVWAEAATQIFYSLGIGFGSLIAFGSYNKFHNNVFRDAIIVSTINCTTSVFAGFIIFSVLGFMAHVLNKEVAEVATSGPGLAFIVFPECIGQMPISPFWSICFFFMLLTLGLDTQFAMFEAVVTGLVDEYPQYFKKRKELFIALLCFICFLLGIPMVAQGGMYVLNLYNWQSGGVSLVFLAFFEAVTVAWGYGADRFAGNVQDMTGNKPWRWWTFCWKFCTPTVTLGMFLFSVVQWSGVWYGNYKYPDWAEFMGWILALSSMIWIPGVALYKLINQRGASLADRFRSLTRPDMEVMKAIERRENLSHQNELANL